MNSEAPTASKRTRGFTLLEVMIALAIAGIALIALLSLGNRSIGVNGRLQMITQATLLAQEKMGEIESAADRGALQYDNEDGGFTSPFDRFHWRISFEETPLPSVKRVTVKVLWGEENKNELVELNSFLF